MLLLSENKDLTISAVGHLFIHGLQLVCKSKLKGEITKKKKKISQSKARIMGNTFIWDTFESDNTYLNRQDCGQMDMNSIAMDTDSYSLLYGHTSCSKISRCYKGSSSKHFLKWQGRS